jgi:hypothetical protein
MRILVLEDEKKVAKALRDGLEAHHYDVDVAATGEDGFSDSRRRQVPTIGSCTSRSSLATRTKPQLGGTSPGERLHGVYTHQNGHLGVPPEVPV